MPVREDFTASLITSSFLVMNSIAMFNSSDFEYDCFWSIHTTF